MPEIHLLQAKLHLHAGDYSKCLSSLESGISYNFEVSQRDHFSLNSLSIPSFHFNEFFIICYNTTSANFVRVLTSVHVCVCVCL